MIYWFFGPTGASTVDRQHGVCIVVFHFAFVYSCCALCMHPHHSRFLAIASSVHVLCLSAPHQLLITLKSTIHVTVQNWTLIFSDAESLVNPVKLCLAASLVILGGVYWLAMRRTNRHKHGTHVGTRGEVMMNGTLQSGQPQDIVARARIVLEKQGWSIKGRGWSIKGRDYPRRDLATILEEATMLLRRYKETQ